MEKTVHIKRDNFVANEKNVVTEKRAIWNMRVNINLPFLCILSI